ncbi:unnamed protein product [Ixodes hexagonus]
MEAAIYRVFNSHRRRYSGFLVGTTVLLVSALTQVNSGAIGKQDHATVKKILELAQHLRDCPATGKEGQGTDTSFPTTTSTTAAAGDLQLCPSRVTVDYDRFRIPENITTVECRCGGYVCPALGAYRCTGIQHPFPVEYKNGTRTVLHVNVACACVRNPAAAARTVQERTS